MLSFRCRRTSALAVVCAVVLEASVCSRSCSAAAPRRQDGNLASVAHASFLALVYGKYQYEASDRRGFRWGACL
jgi:hypothetical protein